MEIAFALNEILKALLDGKGKKKSYYGVPSVVEYKSKIASLSRKKLFYFTVSN